MTLPFPSDEWLNALKHALNSDTHFATVARNWEGDVVLIVEGAGGRLGAGYFDIWRGECRAISYHRAGEEAPQAKFELRGPLQEFLRVLRGEIDPIQAVLTRRIRLKGPLGYLLRSAHAVLEFVQVARSIATEGVGQPLPLEESSHLQGVRSEGSPPQPTA